MSYVVACRLRVGSGGLDLGTILKYSEVKNRCLSTGGNSSEVIEKIKSLFVVEETVAPPIKDQKEAKNQRATNIYLSAVTDVSYIFDNSSSGKFLTAFFLFGLLSFFLGTYGLRY